MKLNLSSARAVISLLAFLGSLWIGLFLHDLENTPASADGNTQPTSDSLPGPAARDLGLLQLVEFLVVTAWSMLYVVMSFLEIREFRASRAAAVPESSSPQDH
ncbi:hypothetical protein B0H14DRAFT_2571626 [Mycena olivaceomarginata]|nr:hypothetical protein B0H14DRAFT_2571626 [Mycena olivaceomarginata]